MVNKVYLGLGSNLGNRIKNLAKAVRLLHKEDEIEVQAVSSFYFSKPYGKTDQQDYVNIAVCIETDLEPDMLLKTAKQTEVHIGREKREKWGPRVIDIDILLFGDVVYEDEKLSIPHKELGRRDFFLVPLHELDNNLIMPGVKKPLKYYLDNLNNSYIYKKAIIPLEKILEKTDIG